MWKEEQRGLEAAWGRVSVPAPLGMSSGLGVSSGIGEEALILCPGCPSLPAEPPGPAQDIPAAGEAVELGLGEGSCSLGSKGLGGAQIPLTFWGALESWGAFESWGALMSCRSLKS